MKMGLKRFAAMTALLAPFFAIGTAASAATCESLAGLKLPHATITAAQSVTDGNFAGPGAPISLKGLPPFCRVAVQSSPTPDSLINIEVWIPIGEKWNGKYQQLGCGGYCGTMSFTYPSLAQAIRRGYASAATDDGNQSAGDPRFALGHPEKITDFGYRALKETTDTAKAVIAAFSGQGPRRSYFKGCSDGGREALMEAQRYPNDFDGIIVGAPANNWIGLVAGMVANEKALLQDPAGYISPPQLAVLSKAVLAQCGKQDSGAPGDAFLSDPLRCKFDPTTVQCSAGQDPDTCLNPAQVKTAKAVYGGLHDPHTKKLIAPGFVPGNEDDPGNWPVWITGASREANLSGNEKAPTLPLQPTRGGLQGFYGNGFFANFVYQNPNWDFRTFDPAIDVAAAEKVAGKALNSTDPDLRPFQRHGGKIIHYHGWGDIALTPKNSIAYYNDVKAVVSGKKTGDIDDFYRLFMVPGMGHCGGGPGATQFGGYVDPPVIDADHDMMQALERWVEQGVAPDKIIATRYVNGKPDAGVQFQRPLCPFPRVAHYDGKGDPNDAKSFTCR